MKIIPLKRLTTSLILLNLMFPLASFTNSLNVVPHKIQTIVIDAGHGGHDGSTQGKYSKEKDVALRIALLVGKTLEENLKDVKVIYTRKSDVFVPLYERIDVANKANADLFISIHCNSMPSTLKNRSAVRGVETLVAGFGRLGEQDVALRENASILLEKENAKDNYAGFDPKDPASVIMFSMMKNTFREQSIRLATLIQDEYVSTGRIDRGVKEQPLAVLQRAAMPAVLTEIGFISSPEEEDYLNSEAGQNEVANCLLKAVQAYKRIIEIE
jgi:N-acetylmuramoyl-L-alanine amidase